MQDAPPPAPQHCGPTLVQPDLQQHCLSHLAACAGDTYLVLDRSLRDVAAHLAASVQSSIRVRWPVTSIRHDAGGVTLQGPAGRCASLDSLLRQLALQIILWLHVKHPVSTLQSLIGMSAVRPPPSAAPHHSVQRSTADLSAMHCTGCCLQGGCWQVGSLQAVCMPELCWTVEHIKHASRHAGGVVLSPCSPAHCSVHRLQAV